MAWLEDRNVFIAFSTQEVSVYLSRDLCNQKSTWIDREINFELRFDGKHDNFYWILGRNFSHKDRAKDKSEKFYESKQTIWVALYVNRIYFPFQNIPDYISALNKLQTI